MHIKTILRYPSPLDSFKLKTLLIPRLGKLSSNLKSHTPWDGLQIGSTTWEKQTIPTKYWIMTYNSAILILPQS